jgi:hypothetical protein
MMAMRLARIKQPEGCFAFLSVFDAKMLTALRLDAAPVSKGYLAAIRSGHCVVGLFSCC